MTSGNGVILSYARAERRWGPWSFWPSWLAAILLLPLIGAIFYLSRHHAAWVRYSDLNIAIGRARIDGDKLLTFNPRTQVGGGDWLVYDLKSGVLEREVGRWKHSSEEARNEVEIDGHLWLAFQWGDKLRLEAAATGAIRDYPWPREALGERWAISPDEEYLVAPINDRPGRFGVWRVAPGRLTKEMDVQEAEAQLYPNFAEDRNIVELSGSRANASRYWDLKAHAPLPAMPVPARTSRTSSGRQLLDAIVPRQSARVLQLTANAPGSGSNSARDCRFEVWEKDRLAYSAATEAQRILSRPDDPRLVMRSTVDGLYSFDRGELLWPLPEGLEYRGMSRDARFLAAGVARWGPHTVIFERVGRESPLGAFGMPGCWAVEASLALLVLALLRDARRAGDGPCGLGLWLIALPMIAAGTAGTLAMIVDGCMRKWSPNAGPLLLAVGLQMLTGSRIWRVAGAVVLLALASYLAMRLNHGEDLGMIWRGSGDIRRVWLFDRERRLPVAWIVRLPAAVTLASLIGAAVLTRSALSRRCN